MGNKIYRLELRIDEETKEKVDAMCNTSRGLTQSKVIRKAINDCQIEDIKGKAEIISFLKRSGTNLNQIARRLNSVNYDPEFLNRSFKTIEEYKDNLKRLADKY